jgi:hypothetical protein
MSGSVALGACFHVERNKKFNGIVKSVSSSIGTKSLFLLINQVDASGPPPATSRLLHDRVVVVVVAAAAAAAAAAAVGVGMGVGVGVVPGVHFTTRG